MDCLPPTLLAYTISRTTMRWMADIRLPKEVRLLFVIGSIFIKAIQQKRMWRSFIKSMHPNNASVDDRFMVWRSRRPCCDRFPRIAESHFTGDETIKEASPMDIGNRWDLEIEQERQEGI